MSALLLKNCRIYNSPSGENVSVLLRKGKIEGVFSTGQEKSNGETRVIDCGGKILAPGFVDIHIQGAGGADFLDNSKESIETICRTLPRFGVTGILATTIVKDDIKNQHLRLIAEFESDDRCTTNILGIHLEGPFINRVRRGGIDERSIMEPNMYYLEELLENTGHRLKMMTIAPELSGMDRIIQRLIKENVVPSLGHSDAKYQEAIQAFNIGISHVTHIFNAMRPVHHREPGPVIAVFNSDEVTVQLICDGVHVSPVMVNFLRKMVGGGRIALISDGISGLGYNGQSLVYNNREYQVKNGTAMYINGTFIGTALPVTELARRYMKYTGCGLVEAIESISLVPLRIIGLDCKKGRVKEGYDADLVVVDEKLEIFLTIINGEVAYSRFKNNLNASASLI